MTDLSSLACHSPDLPAGCDLHATCVSTAAKHLTATISEPRRSSDAQQRPPTGEQGASKRPKLEPPATNGHVPGLQQPHPQLQPLQPKQEPSDQQQPAGQVCHGSSLLVLSKAQPYFAVIQGYSTVGVCRLRGQALTAKRLFVALGPVVLLD